ALKNVKTDPAAESIPWKLPGKKDGKWDLGSGTYHKTPVSNNASRHHDLKVPGGLVKPEGVQLGTAVPIAARPEAGETLSWNDLYKVGQNIEAEEFMVRAPVWGEIAERANSEATQLMDGLRQITADSWESEGGDQALAA